MDEFRYERCMNDGVSVAVARRPIPALRWWIGGLLFASTVINYIDRQTLSVLAPLLKKDYHWTNQDYAWIVISFRIAYAVGQTVSGRLIDLLGTRRGLTVSVAWYSLVAMATSMATGLRSFAAFRFLLGAGESANWPGATKAVAEWFPKRERGWAVALFDSGSSIGGAVAPFLVLFLYHHFGSWRPAFLITGTLGFLWLIAWRRLYHPPASHPRVSETERAMIHRDHAEDAAAREEPKPRWSALLRLRHTWGVIIARSLSDPVWFFITDWFPIYLVAKGITLEGGLITLWIPFVAADLGNFFGGGASSQLIRRGWPVDRARKAVLLFGGLGMVSLMAAVFSSKLWALAAFFAVSTFAYAAFSTMALVLPSDLFPSRSVASVSGMSGTGAGIGTIISTWLIGYAADHYSFDPVLIAASTIPLVATGLVLWLLRQPQTAPNRSAQRT
ncbi:MAG: MFS transporter [Acidobacteria bacterium]|jgi:ACS family hexuronate transporter-like MFS transporter|nr:MFS transporter [Acidobacteriota bacterium]